MDIQSFLKNPGYVINHYPDTDIYEAILDQSTNDLIFYYKEEKITKYEAYNKLTDSSCMLSNEDLAILEDWIKNKLK